MSNVIIDIIVNWIAIVTFLFFLLGAVLKGVQNLSYTKKSKSDSFKMISEEEALDLLENPLVLDIRTNTTSVVQDFYIKFSERIFNLKSLSVNEKAITRNSIKITKYDEQDIEFNTSIIDVEESLVWSTEIREFYSMGKLTWKTATGMKGEFIPEIAAGKERKCAINIVYKHTLQSRIYHFFQR